MTVLRSIIAALGLALLVYTLAVIPQHGINLLPVFLGDVFAVNWSGQFNLDFASYLLLSGLWVAWRGGFSRVSIVVGLIASVAGMVFFAPYVLWLSLTTGRELHTLLLGVHARRD